MDTVFAAIERVALPKRLSNFELRRWDLVRTKLARPNTKRLAGPDLTV
jgi:hypothetical protein